MAQTDEMKPDGGFMSTKFGKVFFTIVAVFLTFAGPTYVIYALNVVLKMDLAYALLTGFVLFVVGLVMMRYLVKLKIIT